MLSSNYFLLLSLEGMGEEGEEDACLVYRFTVPDVITCRCCFAYITLLLAFNFCFSSPLLPFCLLLSVATHPGKSLHPPHRTLLTPPTCPRPNLHHHNLPPCGMQAQWWAEYKAPLSSL